MTCETNSTACELRPTVVDGTGVSRTLRISSKEQLVEVGDVFKCQLSLRKRLDKFDTMDVPVQVAFAFTVYLRRTVLAGAVVRGSGQFSQPRQMHHGVASRRSLRAARRQVPAHLQTGLLRVLQLFGCCTWRSFVGDVGTSGPYETHA